MFYSILNKHHVPSSDLLPSLPTELPESMVKPTRYLYHESFHLANAKVVDPSHRVLIDGFNDGLKAAWSFPTS